MTSPGSIMHGNPKCVGRAIVHPLKPHAQDNGDTHSGTLPKSFCTENGNEAIVIACPTVMTKTGYGFAPPSTAFDPATVAGRSGCECTKMSLRNFDFLFTSEDLARITAKVALVPDESPMIAEDDSGARYNYGEEGFPERAPDIRATECWGQTKARTRVRSLPGSHRIETGWCAELRP